MTTTAMSQAIPLHRVRFVDYTPSPITALAFSPTPLPTAAAKGKAKEDPAEPLELGVLVLARDNGDIEVWEWVEPEKEGQGNWILEKVLPPTLTHANVSLMCLVIRDPAEFPKSYRVPRIPDLRLYTAGSDSGDVVERCLITGRILQSYTLPAAPLWAMSVSPTHSLLCLASTSPNLHFLSITPAGLEPPPPHLLRVEGLPSRTRTVSIAWGPPKPDTNSNGDSSSTGWRDTYVVTGNSDSSFRKFDIVPTDPSRQGAGRVVLAGRAVLEKVKAKQHQHKGSIVWGIAVLPDHTIVTSDSLGKVIFWDGRSLAQKQAFRSHKADAMCLAVGSCGRTVYTAGPDQRVCQFVKVGAQWTLTATKRAHTHDIRALAVFPAYVPAPPETIAFNQTVAPVVASGGWDMQLVLSPAASPDVATPRMRNPLGRNKGQSKSIFEEAFPRKTGHFGGARGTSRVCVARAARLVVARHDRSVGVWRVNQDESGWEKLLEMDFKLRTSLTATTISDDGRWLAVSDLYETKLFSLVASPTGAIVAKRVKTFLSALLEADVLAHLSLDRTGTGASALLFTPDSERLVIGLALSGQVAVVDLREVRVAHAFKRDYKTTGGRVLAGAAKGEAGEMDESSDEEDEDMESDAHSSDRRPIGRIANMAASADAQWLAVSDLLGRVSVFNLDTLRPHSVLPTFPSPPITLLFSPTDPSLLGIVLPNQTLAFYAIELRTLLPASAQLAQLNTALHDQFTPVLGAAFEPSRADVRNAKLVLWGAEYIVTARLDLDWIKRAEESKGNARKLRKRLAEEARAARGVVERGDVQSPAPSASVDGSALGSAGGTGIGSGGSGAGGAGAARADSSVNDPDFYKVTHDRFGAIMLADWMGEGEMMVVERPYADYSSELPAPFFVGTYGRG